MLSRCYNPINGSFERYGATGTTVCEQWHKYPQFKKWALENGYEPHLTIDRYPNIKGNYEPCNCRWATTKQQANNKGNNHLITIDGEIKTISEWADKYGISQQRVAARIKRGWDEVEAVTKPTFVNRTNKRYLPCQ